MSSRIALVVVALAACGTKDAQPDAMPADASVPVDFRGPRDLAFDPTCPGLTRCGDACFNLASDVEHCGSCDNVCSQTICSGGSCECACAADETCCQGTCSNLQVDPTHCGGCNIVCPPGAVCSNGQCACGCTGVTVLCGASGCNCVNPQIDPSNCGACGNVCPTGVACVGGVCK